MTGLPGKTTMMNSLPPMRDEEAIPHLTRARQRDGTVCYFFGDTTIRVTETQTAGKIQLTPISGDQVACGEWADLDEEQVRRYCELLTLHLNSGKSNDMDTER